MDYLFDNRCCNRNIMFLGNCLACLLHFNANIRFINQFEHGCSQSIDITSWVHHGVYARACENRVANATHLVCDD